MRKFIVLIVCLFTVALCHAQTGVKSDGVKKEAVDGGESEARAWAKENADEIIGELKQCADTIAATDMKMLEIRKKIEKNRAAREARELIEAQLQLVTK